MAPAGLPTALRRYLAALRMLLVFTVLTGIAYPLAVTGVAQALLPGRANGSLLTADGRPVGSRLLGQNFALPGTHGARPDPAWFQPRPSAADYDPGKSGASNLGPNNPALTAAVRARRAAVAAFDGVPAAAVPPDAVTAGGSGLDPDISPAYAYEQVSRVARARRVAPARVRALVERHVEGRQLGFLGQPHVNVLLLNRALGAAGR
ncbi:potassium-transporting ATPase subunit KdpC [Streptomyces catenulae]|uniref:Potassium-transporting ATPase KdpC subunit n=1 Tax=Streptomyces catenulae TaxID=66875 RepID=A0ABV2Z0Y3_9ACTN|nr:potassium-transporting ATPase subunit KdpC [Streptomyces catenulae]